jgi:hypothetical protein
MSGTSGISEDRKEEWVDGSELSSKGWPASLPQEETESIGVTLEGMLPSIEMLADGAAASPPDVNGGEADARLVISGASRGKTRSGEGRVVSESEDRMMGVLGRSPKAGRGVMREGEWGAGATMPSDEVSIGDEPPELNWWRDWMKAGPCVTTGGIPLAGRTAWRAFQKSSETTVRASELPWDAAIAVSISTMVVSTVVVGMWAMAALTAAILLLGEGGGDTRPTSLSEELPKDFGLGG